MSRGTSVPEFVVHWRDERGVRHFRRNPDVRTQNARIDVHANFGVMSVIAEHKNGNPICSVALNGVTVMERGTVEIRERLRGKDKLRHYVLCPDI